MNDIDFERAAMLMSLIQSQATVAPMMTSIAGEAGEELKIINEACKQNGAERADKIRKEEQVAEQQRLEAAEDAREEINQNAKPYREPAPLPQGVVPQPEPYMPGQPVPEKPQAETDDVKRRL